MPFVALPRNPGIPAATRADPTSSSLLASMITPTAGPDQGRSRSAIWLLGALFYERTYYRGNITIAASRIAVIPAMTVIRTECVPT